MAKRLERARLGVRESRLAFRTHNGLPVDIICGGCCMETALLCHACKKVYYCGPLHYKMAKPLHYRECPEAQATERIKTAEIGLQYAARLGIEEVEAAAQAAIEKLATIPSSPSTHVSDSP